VVLHHTDSTKAKEKNVFEICGELAASYRIYFSLEVTFVQGGLEIPINVGCDTNS
jgi:hypothetical protein